MEQNQSDADASKHSAKTQNNRRRKRQYFNRIRQQMEFYFGDANLSKDRYLNKLIAINPYVPLDVFLNFNKIKELKSGVEEIQKALQSSEMLELSDDRQSVRRVTEIRKKDNIDEYMIYVEALPPNATHESVRQQFKQFGNVSYVSLPKYRTSGRIKEFAFIEFEEKSSVEKCIDAFRQFDAVIGDTDDPENLKSVSAYVQEQEDLEKQDECQEQNEDDENPNDKKNKEKTEIESENKEEMKKDNEKKCDEGESNVDEVEASPSTIVDQKDSAKSATKRTNEEATTGDSDGVPSTKRLKTSESEEQQDTEIQQDNEDNEDKEEKEETECQGNTTDEKASVTDEQDRKKKNRRRRKRNQSQINVNNDSNLPEMPPIPVHMNIPIIDDIKISDESSQSLASLRVATKVEWKRLRNTYLTLQRQKYSEIKKLLQQSRQNDGKKKSTLPPSKVRPVTMKSKVSSPPPKKICTRNINFYGANRDEHNANTYECSIINENKPENDVKEETEPVEKKHSAKDLQFEFEPGLIVKVNFDQPCTDITDFKGEMRQYPFVQYVDIKEGQTYAYVRVDIPRSAPILIKHCAPNRCQILTGESETEYWAKIARDREQKLSKAVKVPKNRSRKMKNLIRNIAEINVVKSDNKTTITHIRFDDD